MVSMLSNFEWVGGWLAGSGSTSRVLKITAVRRRG